MRIPYILKALFCAVVFLFTGKLAFAQHIYQIRADTVRISNTCDTAELVLENHTQDTLGFLFNKGKGRTEFRRLHLQRIGNSQLSIPGQDTIDLSGLNMETLQSVIDRGNFTTKDILFAGSSNPSPGLSWNYLTDYWKIFVEAPQDTPAGDLIFENGDNDQEGWQFRTKTTGGVVKQVLNIQPEGTFTFLSNNILHTGNHAAGSAFSQTLTGANVFSTITTNASGHVTQLTTRALTPADIGAAPASTSGSYIQNQTAADQPSSGFRITGTGRSNSQFQIVKDGSNSIASAFQLYNAASTRGANIQLDANTNPGLNFWVHDGTDWQNRMLLAANGAVGIGTTSPIGGVHVVNNTTGVTLESTRTYATTSGGLYGAYNRGTPTAANQRLGGLIIGALTNGTELRPSSQIDVLTSAAWTNDASQPSYMRFMTTAVNAFQPSERMRIAADGTVTINVIPALGTAATNFLTSNAGAISSRTAAQVLADIGAAPASASGNYIQNLSSGTQTANFSISGTGNAATGFSTPLLFSNNSAGQLNLVGGATGASSLRGGEIVLLGGSFGTTPGEILFRTGTGGSGAQQPERVRIDADGNVGIGTSNPTAPLHVNGAASVGSLNGLGASAFQITSGSSAQSITLIGGATSSTSSQGGAITLFSGGHASQPGMITFHTGTALGGTQQPERMRISATGNIGINNNNPSNTFSLTGASALTAATITTYAARITQGGSDLGIGGDASYSYIQSFNSKPLQINNVGNNVLINASGVGDVGIGTATPAARLDVRDTSTIANTTESILSRHIGDANFRLEARKGIVANTSGGVTGKFGMTYNGIENAMINFHRGASTTGGFMSFSTNDGTERMRIDATGNVGIGTAAPLAKLTVSGTTTSEMFVMNTTAFGGTTGAFARFYNTGTPNAANQVLGGILMGTNPSAGVYRTAAQIEARSDAAWTDGSSHPSNLIFYTVPSGSTTVTERMRIDPDGNVGIGTSNPTAKLEFASVAGAEIQFSGANAANILQATSAQPLYINSTTGSIYLGANGSGSQHISVLSSGNVGIGTTAPANTLHVNGTFRAGVADLGNTSMIRGTATGAGNIAYMRFTNSNGDRLGYVGDATSATNDMYLTADSGSVRLVPQNGTGGSLNVQATTMDYSGGQLYLNNGTSNLLLFSTPGADEPTFSTRSKGTKITLYPGIGASSVDYALGIDTSHMWSSIPYNTTTVGFKWYGGRTQIARLDGTGNLTLSGQAQATSFFQTSLRSLKKDIQPFTASALKVFEKAQVRTFKFKADASGKTNIGFIADEVPDEMTTPQRNGVDQSNTVALLVKAVQELTEQNKALQQEIKEIKEQLKNKGMQQ